MNPTWSVESQLKDFISKNLLYSGGDFPYSDDASFLGEGIIDSLGVMELVEFVGTNFGIVVEQSEVTLEQFDSVQRLSAYIRRKKGVQST